MIPEKNRAPQLEGGHSTKIGGMCNPKHHSISPKFYELLIKTELNGENDMYFKNFYNHIKMCLNVVTRLQEDLLPSYQSIKRYSEFEDYFLPYHDHPSYYWNAQTCTSLENSLVVVLTNDTYVKSSMAPQAYKAVKTHGHEISIWRIISRPLHPHTPHLEGMNGDVQSDLATLTFKNVEKLEDFHSRIIRLQQYLILYGETISPTRLIFQCIKSLLTSDKLKSFMVPKMIDLIKFLENYRKLAVYKEVNIH